MKAVENKDSVAEAVAFLSARIAEEAQRDSISLTGSEIKQLAFTEETATAEEIATARAFDDANDTKVFEARISKLLRKAFKDDTERGLRSSWQKHLAALRNHDVYVLVMVDQAGIPRPRQLVRPLASAILFQTLKARPSDIAAGLTTVLGDTLRRGGYRIPAGECLAVAKTTA